jgi:RNA polymerase sigma factor (sigma-70 family)
MQQLIVCTLFFKQKAWRQMAKTIDSMEKEFLNTIYTHQKIIYKVCKLYRDSKEDQEDLFQETIYQLWKSYPAFSGEAKISSWMYRITLNTAIAVFRKKNKLSVDYHETFPEHIHPAAGLQVSDNEERLFNALKTLNDAEKAIVSLYLEGFSYSEMAAITGISENNVGVRLNRIKNKLKQILN